MTARAHLDEQRGHFVLQLPDVENRRAPGMRDRLVVGADQGPALYLDFRGTSRLTPDDARALARCLEWWADRSTHRPEPDESEWAEEINDLFDLLAAKEQA